MSFVKNSTKSQNAQLESYLRGTGRTITEADARARFGIKNLRARVSELRNSGLVVVRDQATTGRARYSVKSRDVNGRRFRVFA